MNLLHALRRPLSEAQIQTVDPLEGYDRWAQQYATERNPVLALEQRALLTLLPEMAGKRVLDLGCGTGRVMKTLAARKAKRIVGLDFSCRMIKEAKRLWPAEASARLLAADAANIPLANKTFDLVTCSLMISHCQELDEVVGEIARVCKPGGHVLLSEFHPFGHLLGWHRSFIERQNDRETEVRIRYFRHLHADYFHAFKTAGLVIDEMLEPCIDESVKYFYEGSRQALDNYKKSYGYPLILCFRLKRP